MINDLDVVLVAAAITTGAVLAVIQLARLWRTAMQQKTIREALSRDSAALPALLEGLETEQRKAPAGANDDRTALVLIALGLATLLSGAIYASPDDFRAMASVAVFPILVGAALLLRYWLVRRRANNN
jgi:uncharacterized membrane protein YqjE